MLLQTISLRDYNMITFELFDKYYNIILKIIESNRAFFYFFHVFH